MPIRSFRGMIADGGQDTIHLHTRDGSMGYRIVKFEMYPQKPGQESVENNIAIWKVEQTSLSPTAFIVNFSDQTLLGVGHYHDSSSENTSSPFVTIFDNEIFNQDIYLTHTDTNSSLPCNYYLELEQIKLDLNENTVATLKDIRNETLTV